MTAVVVGEGVAILLLAVLVLGLLRSHALILRALHDLGAGLELEKDARAVDEAPSATEGGPGPVPVELGRGVVGSSPRASTRAHDVIGTSLSREQHRVAVTGAGSRTLLAFLSSGCSVCQSFWDELSAGDVAVPGDGLLAVVTKGVEEESISTLRRLAGPSLQVVQSSAAWTDYDIPGSPYFVYVEDGVITGEGSSTTWAQVRDLMGQAVADSPESGPHAGSAGSPDNLPRMDQELREAGVHPGHPSLYEPPDGAGRVT